MKNDPHKLDLIKPGIFLLIFLAILGGALFFLNNLDKQRKNQVYQQYKQETENYIQKNRTGLIGLFAQINGKTACSYYNQTSQCVQTLPVRDHIDHRLTHDLKDWSSTSFIVLGSGNDGINEVRLSGDMTYFSGYNSEKRTKVFKFLNGEIAEIPWDDYTYNFPGKEVVIPVKDDSGKVAGAIVRGVIEEKSF